VQIFFAALFEEKLNRLLDPAGQFGIRPDIGYKKMPDYPAGYRCIPNIDDISKDP
jgi:hypothetical protein